jgi:hypothetical protein
VSVLIQSCIVCDLVRPEMDGKLIILGFLCVCPRVDIRVARLDRPTPPRSTSRTHHVECMVRKTVL